MLPFWYTYMGILARFYPDEYRNSSYELEYERYYAKGVRGIIFDIDNTLVEHGAAPDERAVALMQKLNEIGFSVLVLSNNKQKRVESFAEGCGSFVKYIFKADKPAKRGYIKAMEMLGTDITDTMFVGDQIFTDVWGAKRIGIHSILVKPIDPREEIQIVLKRYLEKIVLLSYRRYKAKREK